MKPIEALMILDRAASMAHLSREDHNKVIEAIAVIKKVIEHGQLQQS